MVFLKLIEYFSLTGLFVVALISFGYCLNRILVNSLVLLRTKIGRGGFAFFMVFAITCTILAQKTSTTAPLNDCSAALATEPMRFSLSWPIGGCQCSVADLRITNFNHSNGCVQISVSWPTNTLPSSYINIFGNYTLTNQTWALVGAIPMSQSSMQTNGTWSAFWPDVFSNQVAMGVFPTNATMSAGFFLPLFEGMDADDDGMTDGWELTHGFSPGSAYDFPDSDGDELPDMFEQVYGTDMFSNDSDGDGVSDSCEYAFGSDPNDPNDTGDSEDDALLVDDTPLPTFAHNLNVLRSTNNQNQDYEMLGAFNVQIDYDAQTYIPGYSILGTSLGNEAAQRGPNVGDLSFYANSPGHSNQFALVASGASFKALKTGLYSFQVTADDFAVVTIGTTNAISVTANWEEASSPSSRICVAGEELPIHVALANIGGPASLGFPIWGQYTPIERPKVDLSLTRHTVIFESPYYNNPAKPIRPRRSTKTTLSAQVLAGDLGGTLRFRTENSNCLVTTNSLDVLNNTFSFPSKGSNRWDIVYEGQAASSQKDDVRIVAEFEEHGTGEIFASTTTLTSVEMTLVADAAFPQNQHRHVFGPKEEALLRLSPREIDYGWYFRGGVSPYAIDDGGSLTLPENKSLIKMGIEVDNITFPFNLQVITPLGMEALGAPSPLSSNEVQNLIATPLSERWCGLRNNDLLLKPDYVSFDKLEIQEGSCSATEVWGWCAQVSIKAHDERAGAYSAESVGFENSIAWDMAGYYGLLWDNQSPGGFTWRIPMYWRVEGDAQSGWRPFCVNPQVFELQLDGTFSVKKFGCEAYRTADGLNHARRVVR